MKSIVVVLVAIALVGSVSAYGNDFKMPNHPTASRLMQALRGVYENEDLPPCEGRGLALSGGGDKGAYQAGAIEVLAKQARDVKPDWKYIAGVSVGAINGLGLSMFPVGQEAEAAAFVHKLWFDLKRSDVYTNWSPGREAQGLLAETSLYDSRPLRKYLSDRVDMAKVKTSGRKFFAGAVATETGEFVSFREFDDDLLDGVLGSAMEPMVFSPVEARGMTWFDGGVVSITPIQALIEGVKAEDKCLLKDIDVVICHPAEAGETYQEVKGLKTISLNLRVLDLLENNANIHDMFLANYLYSKTTKFTIVSPAFALKTAIMEFDHEDTMRMFALGSGDATNILEGKPLDDPHRCVPDEKKMKDASRSSKVTIVNKYSDTIELFGHDAEDNCFTQCKEKPLFLSQPCHKIKPGESCTFASNSCKTLRGTDGHAYYRFNKVVNNVVKIHWNNPYVGSNEHSCNIIGEGIKCDMQQVKGGNHAEYTVTFSS